MYFDLKSFHMFWLKIILIFGLMTLLMLKIVMQVSWHLSRNVDKIYMRFINKILRNLSPSLGSK